MGPYGTPLCIGGPSESPTGQDVERKNDQHLRQELDSSWALSQRHTLRDGELLWCDKAGALWAQ